jgi:MFS family permease
MGDFSEFRQHWRPLLACFLGMGSALSLNTYLLSIFAPYLLEEFGWTRSQWAMLGVVQMLIMFCLPVAGRLTDLFGVRRIAAIGALSYPLFLVAIANLDGDIRAYLALYIAQTVICSTSTSTVYSRVVAEAYSVRRGLALAVCGSSPPIIGAFGSPLITAFVEDHGWRAGYLLVAAFCIICAVITLWLLPPHRKAEKPADHRLERPVGVYRTIAGMPVFWIMLAAIFLVNLPFTLAASQLKLVVLEQGLGDSTAAWLVSAFALGSIIGRLVSGAALDYLPAHWIAAIGFVLPFFGLLLLASSLDSAPAVTLAVLLIGLSFGGEADVIPYLVTRYFGIAIYSTVLGLLSAAMGAAMGLGNVLLAIALDISDSYNLYLLLAAAGSFIGSGMFLLLGRPAYRQPEVLAAT